MEFHQIQISTVRRFSDSSLPWYCPIDSRVDDQKLTIKNFRVERIDVPARLQFRHGDRARLELLTADPARFRRLCDPWKPPQQTTTAYEVYMETPYVDGCIFMRTITGEVRCYDLRRG